MGMMDNSADDEEQLATPEKDMNLPGYDRAEAVSLEAGDYRALLVMTRPYGGADTIFPLLMGD